MKRWALVLTGVGAVMGIFMGLPQTANATACKDVTQYGAVRLQVPELPHSGDYALWARLQSTSSPAELMVEINQNECYKIETTSAAADQWMWVPYGQTAKPKIIQLDQAKQYNLTVFGMTDGLRIDSIMLSEPDCRPKDLGNNCTTMAVATAAGSEVEQLPPPSNEAVNGKVQLSQTPVRYQPQLVSVQYTVDGKTIQESTTPEPLDTTLLADGTYTILITTNLNNGQVIRESTVIQIENPNNALSPIVRWIRLNQKSLEVVGIVLGSLVVAIILIGSLKRWYLQRRQRHFHGF